MQIRLAQKHDHEGLQNLLRQLNPNDPAVSEAVYKAFEEILDSQYLHLIVAEIEGNLLGTCYINIVPNLTAGGRPYAVIENVVTDVSHRN